MVLKSAHIKWPIPVLSKGKMRIAYDVGWESAIIGTNLWTQIYIYMEGNY